MLTNFAETATSDQTEGIFGALGIDVQMLIFQIIGFGVLVWLMGKFVYPPLIKAVDARQAKIEEGTKAAEAAEKKAAAAEDKIDGALKKARSEAADIVATAKAEATQMVEKAEHDAKARSERIVADAHETLSKDILAARESLKKDTLALVKQAATLATLGVAGSQLDGAMIKKSLESAQSKLSSGESGK